MNEKARANPQKAFDKIAQNPVLSSFLRRGPSAESEVRQNDRAEQSALNYYNPFDFMKLTTPSPPKRDPRISEDGVANSELVESKLVRVKEGMSVAPIAKEKKLLVMHPPPEQETHQPSE